MDQFKTYNMSHHISLRRSLVISKTELNMQISHVSTHFLANGKNGKLIFMSIDGTMSAINKTPVEGVLHTVSRTLDASSPSAVRFKFVTFLLSI